MRFEGEEISYAQFEDRVAHLAGYLRDSASIKQGDRVAYVGANNPAILDLLFACSRLGAIFVPLNSRLSAPQLAVMLDNADPAHLFAIHIGATVIVQQGFDPDAVLDEIESSRASLMLAPPQFSRQLTSHPRFATTDLSPIRCVAIGSTFVAPEAMAPWYDRKVPTQQNYGLTEGVPVLSSPWEHARRKSDTAGTSVLYSQARVFDAEMNPQPPGEPGELMPRGR